MSNQTNKGIDEQTVRHVAHLARLQIDDEEVARYTRQLADVLDYIRRLNEVDTTDVLPTAHVLDVHNVLRNDEVRDTLTADDALANAPARQDPFFKVPKVLDQEGA